MRRVLENGRSLPTKVFFPSDGRFAYERQPLHVAWTKHDADAVYSVPDSAETDVMPSARVRWCSRSSGSRRFRLQEPGCYAVVGEGRPVLFLVAEPRTVDEPPRGSVPCLDYGIRPDTGRLVCGEINKAVASLSGQGGGVLSFPAGIYDVATVRMASGVSLWLARGAELRATTDVASYPTDGEANLHRDLPPSLVPGSYRRVIEFDHVVDAGLLGPGTINGQGSEIRRLQPRGSRVCINLIHAVGCKRLLFEDVTLLDSEFWNTHLVLCSDVVFQRVKLLNEIPPPGWASYLGPHAAKWTWNNADGINPDSSSHVLVQDCLLHTGDDCLPVKNTGSHRNQLRDVRDIVCRRCLMMTPVTAMKIGTETRGGAIENILFEDIDVVRAGRPIGVELKDGAVARNIVFRDIRVFECNRPFDFMVMRRQDEPGQARFSRLESAEIDGMDVRRHAIDGAWFECNIQGLDDRHAVESLLLSNVVVGGRAVASGDDALLKFGPHVHMVEFSAAEAVMNEASSLPAA